MIIIWRGLDEFTRRLDTADKRFATELQKRIRMAARLIVRDAKKRAPKLTGRLRKSISLVIRKERGTVTEAEIAPRGIGRAYGTVLEHGGVVGRRASKRAKPHSARYTARPFMRPAVTATESEVVKILGRSFEVV